MTRRRVVIIGAGAYGREVLEILRRQAQTQSDIQAPGFIDDAIELKGQTVDGAPILGTWIGSTVSIEGPTCDRFLLMSIRTREPLMPGVSRRRLPQRLALSSFALV